MSEGGFLLRKKCQNSFQNQGLQSFGLVGLKGAKGWGGGERGGENLSRITEK